jgi:hypothetical protein
MNRSYYGILILVSFLLFDCKEKDQDINITECNCFLETAKDTYKYPIRPRSEEWKAFTSSEQMVEATQIPYSILEPMSTIGVFESCVENPLNVELYIIEEPQGYYDSFKKTFNVCKELIKRDDVATELIKRYSLMCSECGTNNYSNFSGKGGNVEYSFASIEILLAQEDILSKASKEQCYELAQLALKAYEKNVKNGQSVFFTLFPVWIAARIMDHYNYPEFLKLKSQNEQISIFDSTGVPLLKVGSDYTENDLFQDVMKKFKLFLSAKL